MYVAQTYVYLCICWPQREAEEPPGGLRSSTQNNLGFRENDRRAPASSFCKLLICVYVCCSANMVLCVSANDLRRPSLAQERQRRRGHSSSSSFLFIIWQISLQPRAFCCPMPMQSNTFSNIKIIFTNPIVWKVCSLSFLASSRHVLLRWERQRYL